MELIKITNSEGGKRVVSARDLHAFLESKQDFTNWIKARISKYDLIEGVDFVFQLWDMKLNKVIEPISQLVTGQYKTKFILTADTAKELSMVEGNDKGKQARKYFIECEKELQKPLSFEEMAKQTIMLADKRIKELESKIESDKPMVAFADTVIKSDENISMTNTAKLIGIGRNKLFEILRDEKILMSKGNYRNTPYQKYIDAGYFEVTEKAMNNGLFLVTLVTPKGQVYITNKLKK